MATSNDASHFRQGLFLSVLFHALIFLFFADILALTVANLPRAEGESTIQMTLLPRLEHLAPAAEQRSTPSILAVPGYQRADLPRTHAPAVLPKKMSTQPRAPEHAAQGEERSEPFDSFDSKGSLVPSELPSSRPPKPPSAADLGQYRLEIGHWAKRHKHYPLLARERGIEGTVVVVISTRAGLTVPQVSLSKSSGAALLDAQALETVGRAVRDAKMPDALHNRDFAIDLPFQFLLED